MDCKCGKRLYPDNVSGVCNDCRREHQRLTPSKPPAPKDPNQQRKRYLPEQLRAARQKVIMLEREAERLGIVVD